MVVGAQLPDGVDKDRERLMDRDARRVQSAAVKHRDIGPGRTERTTGGGQTKAPLAPTDGARSTWTLPCSNGNAT